MKRLAGLILSVALLPALLFTPGVRAAENKRPMTVQDLFRFLRVSDPQISPDGKTVAYVVATVDLANNRSTSSIWLAPTDNKNGGPRQLTNAGKKDRHPRWSPDGRHLLFESNRSGDNQLWVIAIDGGEAKQLTHIASEAGNAIWAPDGSAIAFVSAVFPEYSSKPYSESNAENKRRKEEAEKNPVKARVFRKLFYRHWDDWVEDKRQHLFYLPLDGLPLNGDGQGIRTAGDPRDVTPGDRDAYPTSTTFSTGDDYTFSPDGKYLVFSAVPAKNEAWSTNYDICRVPVTGGSTDWETLTKDNDAADGGPRFSPDHKRLAYRRQNRPGFEADRWELMVVDCDGGGAFTGPPRSVSRELPGNKADLSVDEFVWSDPLSLIFAADENGFKPLFQVFLSPRPTPRPAPLIIVPQTGVKASVSVSQDGKAIAYTQALMTQPPEVMTSPGNLQTDTPHNLSHANDRLLAELDLPRPESVTVPGAGGKPMQMWILKPPGFDPAKKWPLAYLVHGGPQGAWEDGWSYRWNPEVWAAQGYVVALPNPRGSTGFGQKYVDEISNDWGGKCFEDLMAGVAYLEKQPYIDTDRMAAAGASFGGYMMNWFEGHTTKFKTLITHCGVYNFDSMYALTEELWFDEWEHGGPPWINRDSYEKFSPHRFAKNFKTPMLIIHNDLDFRVPVAEGLQLFTTLQRLGVPSKMINFPDEGHWVLKPANSSFWHKEVFAWLAKYAPPGGR